MEPREKKEVFEEAIERMVDAAVLRANPASPHQYARTVRQDMRDRLRPIAKAAFDEHGTLTVDELHAIIDAAEHPPALAAPTVRLHADKNRCEHCGCYGGGGWLPSADRDELGMTPDLIPCPSCAADRHRLHAREHVAEGRADMHSRHAVSVRSLRAIRAQLDTTKGQRA